jgi:hypothetical protein
MKPDHVNVEALGVNPVAAELARDGADGVGNRLLD